MKTRIHLLFAALFSILMLAACKSAQEIIETGRYDDAIDYTVKKLRGKEKKNPDYVLALELAFAKATQKDMDLIKRLRADDDPANWERIYSIQEGMARRQAKIEPLLPLYDSDGNEGQFDFVRVDVIAREAKEGAADYLYNIGLEQLRAARISNNKVAARDAYENLERIERYYSRYRDTEDLMEEAHRLGQTHVLVRSGNASAVVLPRALEQDMMQFEVARLNSFWEKYYLSEQARAGFDYEVLVKWRHIDATPEQVSSRQFEESKVVEDGWEYVLDAKGNVLKDTLGNDVKTPKKVTVSAYITEVYQRKAVTLTADIEYLDYRSGQYLDRESASADALFENYAATFQGDRRALSSQTLRRIGNRPLPFPSTEEMLYTAAERLKPTLWDKIKNNRRFDRLIADRA